MKRRNALQLIAIGAAAPLQAQHAGHGAANAASEDLQFFTAEQNALVDLVTEMILPADEHSGGASAAKVSLFIDDLLAASEPDEQQSWTNGLKALDAASASRYQKPFVEASAEQRDAILAELAANEEAPKSELDKFFVKIKRQTVSGYYTSRVGLIDELEYKGGGPIAEYPLCDHPEHTF